MSHVHVDGDDLVVEQSTLDKVVSLHGTMRFPLAHVVGITADPGVGSEPKGVRAPGTHVPGLLTAGTFHHEGRTVFWNIRRGTHAVVIALEGEELDQVIVDVDDPQGVVDLVNAARRR
jgi:hypothetical protein